MIIVYHRHDTDELEPVLAYDADEEELWGVEGHWKPNLDKVGLTGKEFAAFFEPPNYVAGKYTDEGDPFEDIPDGSLRNYPPGSEEIPDTPTVEPLDRDYEREYDWDDE